MHLNEQEVLFHKIISLLYLGGITIIATNSLLFGSIIPAIIFLVCLALCFGKLYHIFSKNGNLMKYFDLSTHFYFCCGAGFFTLDNFLIGSLFILLGLFSFYRIERVFKDFHE